MTRISKALIRTLYDIQHERIQTGNRICAEIKSRLGQAPGRPEETMPEESQKYLAEARREFARISDAFVLTSAVKYLTVDYSKYRIITDAGMLVFMELYDTQLSQEEHMAKVIAKIVATHPLWDAFLEGVRGIGPLMSAVVLSEIDIHKAERVSQVWALAGLDVVGWVKVDKAKYDGFEGEKRTADEDGGATSYWINDGRGRGRYREHLVTRQYIDRNGKPAWRDGITFNPFLKTKLVGVLATSFIKQPPDKCKYRKIYDDYKHRLENSDKHASKTKGHRHAMAMRYMVKMFLQDLWVAWRTLENLPVTLPYHEAVLGHKHHETNW